MRRAMLALGIAVLCSVCAAFQSSPPETVNQQTGQLMEAQKLQREGKYAEAVEAFRVIVRDHPGTEWAAAAQFSIAMSLVSADNAKRDYAQALAEFDEFVGQFPQDRKVPEAQSWRLAIRSLLDAKKENDRLSKTLDKLKKLDVQQEERRLGR